ncbi:MAG TPA: DUF5317 domain-containing protein [Mycobacteriales bacterium]|nr:DUF5317 domain-containing protein [Mycobacteriales bacterium]
MGLVLVVVLAAAAVAAVSGGSWESLNAATLRAKRLVILAVLAQLLGAVLADHGAGSRWYPAGLAASAACALAFCAWNLRVAGVPLVALGLISNAVVVALNGAMPVSIDAASRAGVSTLTIATGNDPRHTIAGYGSVWRSLGDVIPVPLPAVPEVVSAGDVLVAAGLAEFVIMTARRRRDDEPADQVGDGAPHASHALSTIARRS